MSSDRDVHSTEFIARDIRTGMISLRDLVVGSALYGVLPTVGVLLDPDLQRVLVPLAGAVAVLAGSGGAVVGYLWFRPSEEDREVALLVRSPRSVRITFAVWLLMALSMHLVLWQAIDRGWAAAILGLVALTAFMSIGFYGLLVGGLHFLKEQRALWSTMGRGRMHEIAQRYRRAQSEDTRRLEKVAAKLDEALEYTNMLIEAQEVLFERPDDPLARARRDVAMEWFAEQDAKTAEKERTDLTDSDAEANIREGT